MLVTHNQNCAVTKHRALHHFFGGVDAFFSHAGKQLDRYLAHGGGIDQLDVLRQILLHLVHEGLGFGCIQRLAFGSTLAVRCTSLIVKLACFGKVFCVRFCVRFLGFGCIGFARCGTHFFWCVTGVASFWTCALRFNFLFGLA